MKSSKLPPFFLLAFVSVACALVPHEKQHALQDPAKQCTFDAQHLQVCQSQGFQSYINIRYILLPSPPKSPQHVRFVNVAAQRPGNENGFVRIDDKPYDILWVGDKKENEATLRIQGARGDEVQFEYKGARWDSRDQKGVQWCQTEAWDSGDARCGDEANALQNRTRRMRCGFNCSS